MIFCGGGALVFCCGTLTFWVHGNFWTCGFWLWEFFGHIILVMRNFFGHAVLVMGILDIWVLVMEIDELNSYVAKSQELR